MTHQSDTSSFHDRAHNDGFATRLWRASERAAAWSPDLEAEAIAAWPPADAARSATDDPIEPLALGELVYLQRGARLGQSEIYVLRDAVVSLSIEMDCHVALARDGDMAGLHQLLLPTHPKLVATVVRQGHAMLIQQERLRRAMRTNEALYLRLLEYAFRTNAAYLSEAVSSTALTVEQRVARWLVRYAIASHEAGIEITHQELAALLTVRRAGVTNALHILEGDDLLRSRRCLVEFLNLDRLAAFACLRSGDLRSSAGAVHN
jgi:CRP-like cAMP-binding protein